MKNHKKSCKCDKCKIDQITDNMLNGKNLTLKEILSLSD